MQVQVKRNGDDEKFMAEVLAIGNECDLALLTVKNEAFWQGAKLLKLGSLPRLKVNLKSYSSLLLVLRLKHGQPCYRCNAHGYSDIFKSVENRPSINLSSGYRQCITDTRCRIVVCTASCDGWHAICRIQLPCWDIPLGVTPSL